MSEIKLRPAICCLLIWSSTAFWSDEGMDISKVMQKGLEFERQGRCVHAVREFKRVIQARPQYYVVYNRLASCFQTLGYPEIAEKYLRKTLEYDPRNSYSRKKLKEILKSRETIDTPAVNEDLQVGTFLNESPQSRLFFIREKKIFSISGDGSDLRPYTQVPLDRIYTDTADRKGLLVVHSSTPNKQGLFYLEIKRGELAPIYESQGAIDNPIISFDFKEIFFLEKLNGKTQLKAVPFQLNQELKPSLQLPEFIEISSFIKDQEGNFIIIGRKELIDPLKIYLWTPGEQAKKITFGLGNDLRPRLSADGSFLAFVRERSGKQELMVKNLQSFDEFPLTHLDGKELNFCFARLSSRIFFGSSRVDDKGSIVSFLGWVDPSERTIHKLQKRSFHYRNLMTSLDDEYLYYLSDYDNNLEIYRMYVAKMREERLTISDADETQYGLWLW